MVEDPDSLVLVMLRRMDAKLDRMIEDVRDLKAPMTNVGERLASGEMSIAGFNRRIDVRLDRIEKRLDLVGAH